MTTPARPSDVLWIPFAYRAKIARPKRRAENRILAGHIPVVLDRLSMTEAPIAVLAGQDAFRHHGGNWLRPVRLPSGAVAKLDEFSRLLAKPNQHAMSWQDYPFHDDRAGLPHLPFGDKVERDDSLPADWTVKSSERGIREGFAKAAAATLVDIDGVLWRSCPEPFLVVRAEGSGVYGNLVVEVAIDADPKNDCAFFPLDRVNDAKSHAEAISDTFNKLRPTVPGIDIRDPSIIKFDPSASLAERIAFALDAKRPRAWFDPKAKDPGVTYLTRLLAAVDRYVPGGDPFPVLAAISALLLSEHRDGRYGTFLRKGFLQIAEPQLMHWAAAYGETIAMSPDEDSAVASIGAP